MFRFCLIDLLAWLFATFSVAAEARTLSEIRSSGELRICIAGSNAEFYRANAEAFANFLGVRPNVTRLADWDWQFHNASGVTVKEASYEARPLADGSCDLFPNDLHIVDWRQTKMRLVPYYKTRKMIVAHPELRQVLKQESDLAGRSAAVQKGTAYESWIRTQNETQFKSRPVHVELAPTDGSMKLVAEHQADFTVIGAEGAFKWVRNDLVNLDLLFPVDDIVNVGWGISPSATGLVQQLEAFFSDSLHVGSDLDRSWKRQYDISLIEYHLFESSIDSVEAKRKTLLAWGVPLMTGLCGVVLAMLFWTRRLNREVKVRRQMEVALRKSEEYFRLLAENMGDMVWRVDQEMRFTYINEVACRHRGFTRDEMIGRSISDSMTPEGREILAKVITKRRRLVAEGGKGQALRFDIPLLKKDGGEIWVEIITMPVYDSENRISGYQGIGRDITARRQSELRQENAYRTLSSQLAEVSEIKTQLEEEAMYNPLTGLHNRRYMDEALSCELARAKQDNYPLAVIMLDLDCFKSINDTYGHAAGDEVLKALAKLLINGVRENDMVYRYGGEEFVVAMPRVSLAQALQRVESWRTELSETKISHGDATITVTLSAGIAGFPEHGEAIGVLLSCADQMLYCSKHDGRNRVTVFGT